ncbi:DedA family protein [Natronosporangium hydrolyticum]|uniref:DedA family protein n=1 Tax=Natronosporangium hydrolyticum TaxID=2811111 RepID=A0A895Y5H5_9ACTN|nr:DedA family protein [Natronosporangium hydrolyticum]QSB12947.1 DedA family protein [Natronosporangium hydrolyticum]
MTSVLNVLEQLPAVVVLTLAVILVLGETGFIFGLLFPVEIPLMFVGFLAYLGEVPLAVAFGLMLGAAMIGDALALRSGRKYGPRVRGSWLGVRVGEHRWQRADRMLHRMGGRSAFVARWVPWVRTLLPRLAGSAGMRYREFVLWNAAGVLTAVGSSVALGYLAGASYQAMAEVFGRATTALLLLLLVIVGIVLAGRWLGRHPDPVRALLSWLDATVVAQYLRRRTGALAARWGAGWALVVNLIVGMGALLGLGLLLSWVVQLTVDHSGLWRADAAVDQWFADRRVAPLVTATELVTTVLRGSVLVLLVAVVAVTLALRRRARLYRDLIGVLGSAGAFLPLVLLALAADLTGGDPPARPVVPGGMFATEVAVSTAAVCTLTWLATRHARWPWAVAGWTAGVIAVVILATARLYPGWHTASETVTAVLLGALWTSVFMIAWATRARVDATPEPASPLSPVAEVR